MFIAMLCCYGLSCAIHLVFCFLMAERMRRISKPFCLLFLLLSCLFSPSSPALLAFGLLLGLIGDVLMLFKKRKLCLAGAMACFAGNHLAYICTILSLSFGQALPDMRLAGFAVLSSAIILFATFSLSLANSLKYPAFSLYAAFLAVEIACCVLFCLYRPLSIAPYLCLLGAVLFACSDSLILFTFAKGKFKRADFFVMLTYLLAQGLLAVPLCLLL